MKAFFLQGPEKVAPLNLPPPPRVASSSPRALRPVGELTSAGPFCVARAALMLCGIITK